MNQKTEFHTKGEATVRQAIAGRDPESKVAIGREPNPVIAEAMAYAAKPFIDQALEDLKGEPNSLLIFKGGELDGRLNGAPGVKVEGRPWEKQLSYKDLRARVEYGYMQADGVQRRIIDNLKVAEDLRREAEELEQQI